MPKYSLTQINAMPMAEFIAVCGHIFENSPWIAEAAAKARPFADKNAMHVTLFAVVAASAREIQVNFLQAHPDLAGREAQNGTMTPDSTREQARAGLDSLSSAELAEINSLNASYRRKHGFPFIACVRHYTKEGIFYEFRKRMDNPTDRELQTALEQIRAITGYRLNNLLEG